MALDWMLVIVLLLSGGLLLLAKLAYHWAPLSSARINPEPRRKLWGWRLYPRVVANSVLSGSLVFALVYAAHPWLIVEGEPSWGRLLLDAVAILLVYDFFYYFMHRFAFHQWGPLRKVHVVHHAVRHPHAVDSLYLHPVETVLGVTLLLSCSVALGPVHPATFCVVFAVYSFLNILVHSGLNLPFFPFRALSYLARKHDVHHTSMKGGNYASLTPIFDKLFGTAD